MSLSISPGRQVSVVPGADFITKAGTAAQFWPKSTTSVSPGSTASAAAGSKTRVFTTLPKTFFALSSPSTPFQQYASTGLSARSPRRTTSAPAVGNISPLNSLFSSGATKSSAPKYGCATRASYSSPSKIAACFTAPATPHFQSFRLVPKSCFSPFAYSSSTTERKALFRPLKLTILSRHQPAETSAAKKFSSPAPALTRSVTS